MTHPARRPKRRPPEEEHENHERWLVSYADMVTLLMCLFIVLFAISQVDKSKYASLQNGLTQGFGAPMSILDHGVSSEDPSKMFAVPLPVNLQRDARIDGAPPPTVDRLAVEAEIEKERKGRVRQEAEVNYANLAQARAAIERALRKAGYPRAARYQITERGLVVSIIADQVLFASASAHLNVGGQRILNAVAPTLQALPNDLAVEGHTNHLRLLPGTRWPSDWELSSYRATTVLRHLSGPGAIAKNRLYAAGFSDTRPLVDPSKPAAIRLNRRVDIVVLSNASAESNALLPGLDAAASRI